MASFIKKFLRRFPPAINGIKYATTSDPSFLTSLIGGALIFLALAIFCRPLSQTEIILFLFSWFLVLITEIQNSSLEEALDKLHPDQHHSIGHSKDLSSGAALLAAILALLVVLFIIFN